MVEADIKFRLSGGSTNLNPNNSLGGDESITNIDFSVILNNLFDDVTPSQSSSGRIDYRCFYIRNANLTTPITNVELWIASETASGSSIRIGAFLQNDKQKLTITGTPDSNGYVIFSVNDWGSAFTVYWESDINTFASNLESLIQLQPGLETTIITVVSSTEINIEFDGEAGNHLIDVINAADSLGGTAVINASKIQNGSPVGTVAEVIPDATTVPVDPVFASYAIMSPMNLGTLHVSDSVPIWVERTTPPGTLSLTNDNFELGFSGDF